MEQHYDLRQRDSSGRFDKTMAAGEKCVTCGKASKDWKLCKCPQTCKICLRYKMLGDRGSCSGCECGNSHNRCQCNDEESSINSSNNIVATNDAKSAHSGII